MYYYITVDILTSQLLLCCCVNGDAKILKFRHFPPLKFQTAMEGANRSGVAVVSMSSKEDYEDERPSKNYPQKLTTQRQKSYESHLSSTLMQVKLVLEQA